MRRKDREITDFNDMVEIIKKCDTCRLAFFDEEFPYIIPLNFGFENIDNHLIFYFHGAHVGKKLELIKRCNKVSFEMDCSHRLITGDNACDYTMEFESVCGNGIIEILDSSEKMLALKCLMKQYSSKESHEFNENEVKATTALKLTVNTITGKRLKLNN